MKRNTLTLACILLAILALSLVPETLRAQDPTKVDAAHYTVISENDDVRILRIRYGPHEKSVMHEHPNAVAVFMTDVNGRFTLPDGKTVDNSGKAGHALWTPAGKHLPENMGDKAFEVILVELKPKMVKPK